MCQPAKIISYTIFQMVVLFGLTWVLGLSHVVGRCSPKNCQEVKEINPHSRDGNYTINLNGTAVDIYCHQMDTPNPKEYINLVEKNFFYYLGGAWGQGGAIIWWYNKTTFYTKVAIRTSTLELITTDSTFSRTEYGLNQNMSQLWMVIALIYGENKQCDTCGLSHPNFTSVADLSGTGFTFNHGVYLEGWGYGGNHTSIIKSDDYSHLTIQCGGCCGGCSLRNAKVVALPNQANNRGTVYCTLKKNDGLQMKTSIASCISVDLASFLVYQPVLEVNINCNISNLKFSIAGIDCGAGVSYGPYIGGLRLVELHRPDAPECHLPFISRTMVDNKCEVNVYYPEYNVGSPVSLEMRLHNDENKTITVCEEDVKFECL